MDPVTALSPFRSPVFRRVWIASLLSNFGSLIQSVGAAWLMLEMTQQPAMVALVQTAVALPVVLLALLGGAIADNLDRRRVMLASQSFMLLVAAALAVAAWQGVLTPWWLLALTFLLGSGSALNAPAWQASVQDMVPRAQVAGAVTLNSMGFNVARSTAPAIGGAIVAAAGAAVAFLVNALSYVALILVLWRWRPELAPPVLPRERLLAAMSAGVRYVLMSPSILTVLTRAITFGLGAGAVLALLPVVAERRLGGGALTYGLLLGAFGLGAVAAAFASAHLRERLSTESLVRSATAAFALAAAVAGISTTPALTLAALLLAGAGWVLVLSTFNVAVQLSAPRWVVGRALALYQTAAFGGLAAGSWLWGRVAEAQDVRIALLAAAVTLAATVALGLRLPLTQSEPRDLDPLRAYREPDTAVPVQPQTGPVVVAIEYRIHEADIVAFLTAMSERRRIRRRDGARRWALLRDLHDPELWIERYTTATWLDYLRHSHRMTRDDAYIPERLRALHRGDEPPRVRRMIERPTHRLPGWQPDPARREPLEDPLRGA